MNISANVNSMNLYTSYSQLQVNKNDSGQLSSLNLEIRELSFSFSSTSTNFQASGVNDQFQKNYEAFESFLGSIGYDGTPIAELSQEEAAALVSDDGFFGIDQTAERIANFVIQGSGGDESMMRAGREGILKGFEEAEAMWGGELPDISYKTIEKATQMIDEAMHDLGYSIMDESV
ncbi:MAG: hypothetical protein U9N52_10245 [Campylobacterota bacterium]|nr:hypothetical protein [Campylobacterota bacterium]